MAEHTFKILAYVNKVPSMASCTQSIAAGDLNGDGKLDLVVANSCYDMSCPDRTHGAVSVLIGNGDGTFELSNLYDSNGFFPDSIAVADLNGDGRLDVVVANSVSKRNSLSGSISVLLGNGDGSLGFAMTYNVGKYGATSIAARDVNGDGKPDLLVAAPCYNGPCNYSAVNVLLGIGDGTFQKPQHYSSGGPDAYSVAVGDLTGDGRIDAVVATGCFSESDCNTGGVGVLLAH